MTTNTLDIKKLREEFNLSQEEFGKLINVTRFTVLKYEKGEVIPQSKVDLINMLFEKLRQGDSTGLKEIYKGHVTEPVTNYSPDANKYIKSLERIIESKDEQIKALQDSITFLKSLVERKTD